MSNSKLNEGNIQKIASIQDIQDEDDEEVAEWERLQRDFAKSVEALNSKQLPPIIFSRKNKQPKQEAPTALVDQLPDDDHRDELLQALSGLRSDLAGIRLQCQHEVQSMKDKLERIVQSHATELQSELEKREAAEQKAAQMERALNLLSAHHNRTLDALQQAQTLLQFALEKKSEPRPSVLRSALRPLLDVATLTWNAVQRVQE